MDEKLGGMATMRSPEEINALMQKVYTEFRYRWCEPGPKGCFCMGCVNMNGPIRGQLTKEEWQAWVVANPEGAS